MRNTRTRFILTIGLMMLSLSTQQLYPTLATPQLSRNPTPAQPLAASTFTNPVLNIDFPDPAILRVGDTYYAYATNGNSYNIQVATSTDMIHWTGLQDALPALPQWAVPQFGYAWAPQVSEYQDVQRKHTRFLMYFVARFPSADGGKECIGTATSDHPMGPFVPRDDQPFICQLDQGGSIDPSAFIDEGGNRYIIWKNDGNSEGKRTWLTLQKTSADGQTLLGTPTLLVTADQVWEGDLVEAPVLWKHDGRYFVFYSANSYIGRKYAVGYAVADRIAGPYTKPLSIPFLASNSAAGISGPGGQDITVDAAGETWLYFHSWTPTGFRRLNLIHLGWGADGLPFVQPFSRVPQPTPLLPENVF